MSRDFYLNSPARLLIIIISVIFLVELLVMLTLRYFGIDGWYSDVLDALSLVALLVPLIFYFIIRPIQQKNFETTNSETRLRAITSHIPDGLITINSKGIIEQANPAVLNMFGYEHDALLGENISCLMHSPYREEHDGYLAHYMETGERHIIGNLREVEGRCKDGQVIDVELQVAHLQLGKQSIFIGLLRDISERKRLEEERQSMRVHMEHTQRLESLGVLAGGVAHDFNNILTTIMGNAAMAQMQTNQASPVFNMLKQIEHSSEKAAELCRQMLAYAGKGSFVVQSCNFSSIIQNMQTLIRASSSSCVQMEFSLADNLEPVEADSNQLQQIIMNLIINAGEAVGDQAGGLIRINTCMRELQEQEASAYHGYEHGTSYAGSYVCLTIEDNGGGVDPSIAKNIFEPFFTTNFTGRGLGLSACLGLVRSHGGLIQFDNRLGKGVAMSVLFPALKTASPLLKSSGLSAIGYVLLADDDPSSLQILVELLSGLGLEVVTASNGQEAVDMFHQHQQQIGVVILNMLLFKKAGVEALRSMRQFSPQLKAILISNYNEAQGNSRLAQAEGARFLQKPIDKDKLRRTLNELLMDKTLLEE